MRRITGFLWTLLIAFLIAFVLSKAAEAHDWYSSTSDPVYSSSCCGGHDCAPVDPEWVEEVPEGFRIRMTVAQAMTVNPSASAPVDAIVPWSRVQSPPKPVDKLFYACIYDQDRAPPRKGVICFFHTPSM